MACLKVTLLIAALLLSFGTERVSSASASCTTGLSGCHTAYNVAKILGGCTAFTTLKSCVNAFVTATTCSQADVDADSTIQSDYSSNPCSGAIPKASLFSLLIVTVIGFFLKA